MENSPEQSGLKRTYWFVFFLGIAYVLLLGLFTWLFNNPI